MHAAAKLLVLHDLHCCSSLNELYLVLQHLYACVVLVMSQQVLKQTITAACLLHAKHVPTRCLTYAMQKVRVGGLGVGERWRRRGTHMDAIGLLVGSEQWVRNWDFDDLNGAALCIWCAGQPVVGIQRDLMLHHKHIMRCTHG